MVKKLLNFLTRRKFQLVRPLLKNASIPHINMEYWRFAVIAAVYLVFYSPKSFSTEASLTQRTKILAASNISSGEGNVGAMRIFESSGSFP